ncbi:glycosyl hydrolase family 28-related protein [Paenibacillus nasutitermitis]|uniref:Rhamnogalacturonase A/B/Epimerase-like pectate lyase domain-containing protein n=1 Tax=Paenibacillus nasutitermitis TaxID=1652958 RepID=A0A917DXF9_9BACL|nr:glycosyl hydrolase family 28-related protein [Paenibacillus nasutitermitis]GGD75991.1 hypothetical protein GCM10010911_37510 [Paenibacillus nasutitermitis]
MYWRMTMKVIALIAISFSFEFYQPSKESLFQASVANAAPVFSVKNYGAVGDGVTDDTKKIARALAAAKTAGGGTVTFEKGVYRITALIDVPPNVSIVGQGRTETTLKRDDNKAERILSLKGNQIVQNIGFESRIGLMPIGDHIFIMNVKFNCKTQGIQMAKTVRNFNVINSLFDGNGYGILSNQKPSYDVKILNSVFRNSTADDIEINAPSNNWLIEDCTFENNVHAKSSAGFGVGVAMKATNITIKDSSFTNIIGQGIHVEGGSQVTIIGSKFKNNGAKNYAGSPKADIAVLSNASAEIIDCIFYAPDSNYSSLAIHNAGRPNPGKVTVTNSVFNLRTVSASVSSTNKDIVLK